MFVLHYILHIFSLLFPPRDCAAEEKKYLNHLKHLNNMDIKRLEEELHPFFIFKWLWTTKKTYAEIVAEIEEKKQHNKNIDHLLTLPHTHCACKGCFT